MKVLIIVPNADENFDLEFCKESREIENGLQLAPNRDQYSISAIFFARPKDIRRRILRDRPEYIHICGHSVKNEGLIIQDDAKNVQFLDEAILKEFFGLFSDTIHCILLNSCYSSEIAKTISKEIDYVIGMKYMIKDEDAVEFAVAFYDGIFSGESIETSFKLASNSLKWNSNTQYPEPILYKKDCIISNINLFDRKSTLIAPSRLPSGNTFFCGRESELNFLTECWNNKNVNVICIKAWGGVGKTALITKWRSQMINMSDKGVEVIFDWSFHSQGNVNNRPVSADLFFDEAFKWFDSKEEDKIIEKGERLAMLVRQKKALIILDGMEALQYSDNFVGKEGEIKDYSLRIFVSMLADYNPGLCVITTRKEICNLNLNYEESVKLLELPYFDLKESKQLLKTYNIHGSYKAIAEIYDTFKGHALSLNLVASYIRDNLSGDADKYIKSSLLGGENKEEIKVLKIMQSYEEWFGDGKQIRILRMLSLFDRPAQQEELKFLIKGTVINGLTDGVADLSVSQLGTVFRQLRHSSLIMEYEVNNTNYLDTHPIIREYFSKQLIEQFPIAYREGHDKLYYYFSNCGKECTDSITQMNLCFRAVYHGCLAEKYEEVYDSIYLPYMKQGEMIYDARILGGNSTNLDAISGFFIKPWTELRGKFDDYQKAAIYAEASFALRSNGFIVESIIPLEKAFDIEKRILNYEEAAMDAGNLSELYLVIGKVEEALKYAEEGIKIAEKSNKVWRHYWVQIAKKADILSKNGKFDFSIAFFGQAESVQKYFDKESERLYGVLAFKKFDALLSDIEDKIYVSFRIDNRVVIEIQEQNFYNKLLDEYILQVQIALNHDLQYKRILHIALDKLILVRINMLKSILQKNVDIELESSLSEIINELYKSGRAEYIPYGLLTRSKYWYMLKNAVKMNEDIIKTQDVIKNRNFELFEIDVLIEKVYLSILNHNRCEANNLLDIANKQFRCIGYYRKTIEIEILKENMARNEL